MNKLLPLLGWFALPVYLWQGLRVRMTSERLPPPPGNHIGSFSGKGDTIRLLVIGDSSAASVGAEDVKDGIACNLAEIINNKTGRPVHWRSSGSNSGTCAEIRDHAVPHLEERDWTHILISAGTNDMKNLHRVSRFKRDFGTLLYALRARYPEARIYWSPMIDMRDVPALPYPLANLMEIRAKAFNAKGGQLCRERFAAMVPRLPIEDETGFSRDGFHASALGYRAWAEHVAGFILYDIDQGS